MPYSYFADVTIEHKSVTSSTLHNDVIQNARYQTLYVDRHQAEGHVLGLPGGLPDRSVLDAVGQCAGHGCVGREPAYIHLSVTCYTVHYLWWI